jgi:hypothetical protein
MEDDDMKTSTQNLMSGVATALLISAGAAWAQTDTEAQGQSGAEIQQTTPTQQGGAQVETDAQTGAGTEVQQGETQTETEAQTGTEAGTQTEEGQAQTEAETEAGAEAGAEAEQQTDTQQQTQEQTQETTVDVEITAEQETRIEQEIQEVDVEPVNVDFDVAIGVSVPGTIVLHPLPIVIVDVVPEFDGFLFFILVDGRIAIVHPETHVIVAVV